MCQLSCSDLTQKVRVDIVYFSFINILMWSPGSGQLRFLGLYQSFGFFPIYPEFIRQEMSRNLNQDPAIPFTR